MEGARSWTARGSRPQASKQYARTPQEGDKPGEYRGKVKHLLLIRHGQYELDSSENGLTAQAKEQAAVTGAHPLSLVATTPRSGPVPPPPPPPHPGLFLRIRKSRGEGDLDIPPPKKNRGTFSEQSCSGPKSDQIWSKIQNSKGAGEW